MQPSTPADFDQRYQLHLKHLKLKGLQPKTIDAYARAIRRMGAYFDYQIDNLSSAQLTDYFSNLIDSHSWSAVKLDLYGFKFYTLHVLGKPWVMPQLIRPQKVQRLPDIVTVDEAQRLSEGLALKVSDIDAARQRVHVHDSKGNRDRLVPLPAATLSVLRRFWQTHRNPELLFPNRHGGLKAAHLARTPLDRGGVQATLRQVAREDAMYMLRRPDARARAPPARAGQRWLTPHRTEHGTDKPIITPTHNSTSTPMCCASTRPHIRNARRLCIKLQALSTAKRQHPP